VESLAATRDELKSLYPGVPIFANLRDAIDADFDGFTIATPAETHFEIARFLLGLGKPVLVEKPLALRSAEAEELARLAKQNGAQLMVGHVLLFHPAIEKIGEAVRAGKIGKLEYLYSNRLNLGTVRKEENILWSFAPHDLSIFQYLIGAYPREVVSRGGAFVQPHIHDSTMTVLTYPDNIVGHIFVSWLHPFKEHRLIVIGSKGMLSFEDSGESRGVKFYEKGINWVQGEPVTHEGVTETIEYDPTPPLKRELIYFVERIADGLPIGTANAESAIEVLRILERATASLLSGGDRPEPDPPPSGPASPAKPPPYFVHASSYVDEGATLGEGTKVWHFSHIQTGARIGEKCSIGQNVNVGNNVVIGSNVKIQNNVSVYEGVEIEDDVFCGPSMVFTNVKDPRSRYPQRGSEHYLRTRVRTGASIGANATIVCGHTIGRHAFIAAGAVVTTDVPDYALMKGVPARRAGWVCECGEILPPAERHVRCPRCRRQYEIDGERVSLHD
jgi:UDP-2-acetamido-3-amino-2,3-dideoxy-glucuronate N-acetyltransferase